MTQKAKVLKRLSKMGFTTHTLDFLSFARSNHQLRLLQHLQQDQAQYILQAWHKHLQNLLQKSATISNKENVVFLDASPLSPALYHPFLNNVEMITHALQQVPESSLFYLCECDAIEAAYRHGCEKYAFENHQEKQELYGAASFEDAYRVFAGRVMPVEQDLVQFCATEYGNLFDKYKLERRVLHTIDTQQANCLLLKDLGIEFRLPVRKG